MSKLDTTPPAANGRLALERDGAGANGHDSSNQRKHTSGNPIQRALIERFHKLIGDKIVSLAPESFLDAGCGEGFVAAMVRQRLPDVQLTGFDLDPAAVEVARRRDPKGTFTAESIFALPYPDQSFDVVGCFEVLEHLPGDGPDAALRELGRVAKHALVLSVPQEPYFSLANAARGKNWDVRPRGSDPDHHQIWTRDAFGAVVRRNLNLVWLGGSLPWTVCVATPKR